MQTQTPVTIGEAAKQCGISPESIRHYERIGLLQKPLRGDNGYRYYSATALSSLATIRAWREVGMSLEDIRGLLPEPDGALVRCAVVQEQLLDNADRLRSKIQRLQVIEQRLRRLARECDGTDKQCPVANDMISLESSQADHGPNLSASI